MSESAGRRLRTKLSGDPVVAPGIYDALSARIGREAGFETLYLGSACCAATRGLPDMSVLSFSDLLDTARAILHATDVDLVVDLDTGYGGVESLRHAVSCMNEIGVAAVHIEDQTYPKRCGYLTKGPSAPVQEMLQRLEVSARAAGDMLVIARTDSLLVSGLDEAIARSQAYCNAGADLIFVNGIQDLRELAAVAASVDKPLLYNISGSDRAPYLAPEDAPSYGVKLTIYPLQAARAAAAAVREYLNTVARGDDPGTSSLISFEEYFRLAGWDDAEAFERSLDDVSARGE